MVCLVINGDEIPKSHELVDDLLKIKGLASVSINKNTEKTNVILGLECKTLWGADYIEDVLCGVKIRLSPLSFYQVNHDCAELLYKKAIELLGAEKGDTVADLFCGTGTIGLLVASKTGARVIGVEIEPSAVLDAKRNAEINKIKNIEFFEGDAGNFDTHVDACIVDPPRKGLSPFMVETLLRLRPQKIVYVSCNPDTLARDIALLQNTYKIASDVYLFNMFPRTSHVETIVCLCKQ
jgi:23S rRNA (uracil1939-C5)-methyltransferase